MLSPIYYHDGIYTPYRNRSCDINITTPDTYNIDVAELKSKFEDTSISNENNRIRLMSKRRLNKIAAQKLLKSRGFLKDNEITYGALTLPDYNKSDCNLERNNNAVYEERECLWTPIRHHPNVKVSNLIKNLENLERKGCLKTPGRYLKRAFEELRLNLTPISTPSSGDTTFNSKKEKNSEQKRGFKKSKMSLIPVLKSGIASKESSFRRSSLEKLCIVNDKKNRDFTETENCSTDITKIKQHIKLTKKSKIPKLFNKKSVE
uniref:LEM domain-containing protein n=1 Tax=Strongyloides venezuelensis TaxID=75913 RepID=A0A0K0G0F1_STRVS